MDIESPTFLRKVCVIGAHGAGETPVLIPNTAVKPSCGDYTATSGKLARCRIIEQTSRKAGFSLFFFKGKFNDTFDSKRYHKTAGRLFCLDVSTSQKTQQPAELAALRQSSAHSCAFDALTHVKTDAQAQFNSNSLASQEHFLEQHSLRTFQGIDFCKTIVVIIFIYIQGL